MTTTGPDLAVLVSEARAGSRRALGRLFSEAERAGADPPRAAALLAALGPSASQGRPAVRVVGFTGPPGSGKSSLAAAVSRALLARGRRVAVLAVDPSSPLSGGAVLGDRVRFSDDAGFPALVVRSLASRGEAGGLARAVPLAVALAAGVGFDDVLVETVGSGQGEVAVVAAVDTTVLVAAPGQGDEVQAMKAGIAELAHIVCVTKADLPGAAEAARQWRAALGPVTTGGWSAQVVLASARTADVADLLAALDARAVLPASAGCSAGARAGGRRGTAAPVGDSDAMWRAAAAAAASGATTATIALLGAALLASARDRVSAAVREEDMVGAAGLDGVLSATDLAAQQLTTVGGLVSLVATVRARLGP